MFAKYPCSPCSINVVLKLSNRYNWVKQQTVPVLKFCNKQRVFQHHHWLSPQWPVCQWNIPYFALFVYQLTFCKAYELFFAVFAIVVQNSMRIFQATGPFCFVLRWTKCNDSVRFWSEIWNNPIEKISDRSEKWYCKTNKIASDISHFTALTQGQTLLHPLTWTWLKWILMQSIDPQCLSN